MKPIVALADDFTGAAEIAGIWLDFGLPTKIISGDAEFSTSDNADLLVIDLDTRRMSPAQAEARVRDVLSKIGAVSWIYKKTDSAMRGHIALELATIMEITGKRRAILVAQNPSKDRVVIGGEYRIKGVPLDQTDFRNDPEHPRLSAQFIELLHCDRCPTVCLNPNDALPPQGIIAGCAASATDVQAWSKRVDESTLAAGGGDFFTALLETRGYKPHPSPEFAEGALTLVVCGSTSDYSRNNLRLWQERGLAICDMPRNLFEDAPGSDIRQWSDVIADALQKYHHAVIAISHLTENWRAEKLRQTLAQVVKKVLSGKVVATLHDAGMPIHLYVEGGATAGAISWAMQWNGHYSVVSKLAAGVVAAQPASDPKIFFIIKPGSYPWPHRLLASFLAK